MSAFNFLTDRIARENSGWPETPLLINFLRSPEVGPRYEYAPASTAHRFHHANAGGLLEHVHEMLTAGLAVLNAFDPVHPPDAYQTVFSFFCNQQKVGEIRSIDFTLAVCLHDIHKIGNCLGQQRFHPNMLKSGKISDAIPWESSDTIYDYYFDWIKDAGNPQAAAAYALLTRNAKLIPDGEHSLALIAALSPELFRSLNDQVRFAIRHHDGYYGGARRELQGNETPLQMLLHFVDMWSSRNNSQLYKLKG